MNMQDLKLHGVIGSGNKKLKTGDLVGFDVKFKNTYQLSTQLTGLPTSLKQHRVASDSNYFYYNSANNVMRIDKKTGQTSTLCTVVNIIQSICLSKDLQHIYILESSRLYKRSISSPNTDVFNVELGSNTFFSVFITRAKERVLISSSNTSRIELRSIATGLLLSTLPSPTENPFIFTLDDANENILYGAQSKDYARIERYDLSASTRSSYYTNIYGEVNNLGCGKEGLFVGLTNWSQSMVLSKSLSLIYSSTFNGVSIGTQYNTAYVYDKDKGLMICGGSSRLYEVENYSIQNVTTIPFMSTRAICLVLNPTDNTVSMVDNTGRFYQINTFREVI